MKFWEVIDATLVQLRAATSADAVLELCPQIPDVSCGDGFWEGGYDEFADALIDAGWRFTWSKAPYHFVMRAPDGSQIYYIEGDLIRGNGGHQ